MTQRVALMVWLRGSRGTPSLSAGGVGCLLFHEFVDISNEQEDRKSHDEKVMMC